MDKHRSDLTEGAVVPRMIRFAIPLLIAQILQALYNVADMFIVGQFMGDAGITAVNNASVMLVLITYVVSGFAVSGTVLVAQYVGAKMEDQAQKVIGTLFTIFIFAGIVITVVGLIVSPQILKFLNTPPESQEEAVRYLRICFGGTLFIAGYNAVSSVLRGLGDSRRPMLFVSIAAIINIVLDYLLVGPLHMGAAGAAAATVFAQGISFILAVITLKRQNFVFDFKPQSFRIDKSKVVPIVKVGLPSAVQSTVVNFSYIFVLSNINAYGLAAATAAGVCNKVDTFAILPTMAFSQAVSATVGQNLGAGKPDRALKAMFTGMVLSLCFTLPLFFLVRHFPDQIISLFGCGADCIPVAEMYVKHVTLLYIWNCISFNINGLANGSGNSLFAMINALTSMVVTRIILVIIFTRVLGWGLEGIFIAMGLCQLAGIGTGTIFMLSKRWMRTRIIERREETPAGA